MNMDSYDLFPLDYYHLFPAFSSLPPYPYYLYQPIQCATPADSTSGSFHALSHMSPSVLLAENDRLLNGAEGTPPLEEIRPTPWVPGELDFELYSYGDNDDETQVPLSQEQNMGLLLFPEEMFLPSLVPPMVTTAAPRSNCHTPAKKFRCERCHRAFQSKFNLTRHENEVATKKIQCNEPDEFGTSSFAVYSEAPPWGGAR